MKTLNWSDSPERFRSNSTPFAGALQEYYTGIFRERSRRRQNVLDKITTAEEAQNYVNNIRSAIRSKFRFPAVKTPLNAQITYQRAMGDHIIEGITFFSRPGVAVSGLFAYPAAPGVHPAVLFLCGHSAGGKFGYYQPIVSDLARMGFAVLSLDPMGQGERRETTLSPTNEHNTFGRRLALAGEQFAAWRAYDAIRGIDYLSERAECDISTLGVTGCSGGCTLMSMVMALDDRPTMAAGSCAITTFLCNVENELPCDIEQLPQHLGEIGMEMADFLIAAAPRPMLLLGQAHDFFDPRGTAEAAADLKKFYTLLGKAGDTDYKEDSLWHRYTEMHRAEMMKFFGRYANLAPIPADKLDSQEIAPEEFFCAPEGKITNITGHRGEGALAVEYAQKAAAERPGSSEDELRAQVKKLLAVKDIDTPYYRVLRPVRFQSDQTATLNRFGIESEPQQVMCLLKHISQSAKQCYRMAENCDVLLYIGHLDSQAEMQQHKIDTTALLCMLDVRGIGEMTPGGCDRPAERDFFHPYQFDYHFASLGDFLNESMLGRRITDVLSTVKLLQSRNCRVKLYGRAQGGITALLAAFIGKLPVEVEDIPATFMEYLESFDHTLPQSMLPFGMLKVCDLDDIIKYTDVKIIK